MRNTCDLRTTTCTHVEQSLELAEEVEIGDSSVNPASLKKATKAYNARYNNATPDAEGTISRHNRTSVL